MAGANKVRTGDADVYEATGDAAVSAGSLVVPSTTAATNAGLQGVDTAGDAATDVLGVAAKKAVPVTAQTTSGSTPDGFPVTYVNSATELTTVYKRAEVKVTYSAATAAFGAKLVSAADGAVRAFSSGDGDTADMIVGECRAVGGVGSGGGVGLALIY